MRDVVWTARTAADPVVPQTEIAQAAKQQIAARVQSGEVPKTEEATQTAQRITELSNQWRTIEPGGSRYYRFKNLNPPESGDTVIQVRYKARGNPIPPNEVLPIAWIFCDPENGAPLQPTPRMTLERNGEVHQFLVKATPVVVKGEALLLVGNPNSAEVGTPVEILFDGDDSLQLLYKVGSFEANYGKALVIILLRLALLSAIGVFFSVFVSFPVACLCTSAFYLTCLGLPFVMESIGANMTIPSPKYDPYGVFGPAIRAVLVPFITIAFPDFSRYDGSGFLVDGRYISADLLSWCTVRTLLYGGLLLLLPGWFIFRRREIAEVIV